MERITEKELLIKKIEEKKEDSKLFREGILKESIRIVLQTAVTGSLMGFTGMCVGMSVHNIDYLLYAISIINSMIAINISTNVITGDGYFDTWYDLIDDIKYKHKLNIEKRELKRKLEVLMLNGTINVNDLGGKKNAK